MLMVLLAATLAACGATAPAADTPGTASAEASVGGAEESAEPSADDAEESAAASMMASEEASPEASMMASEEASAEASAEVSEEASPDASAEASDDASPEATAEASDGAGTGGALPDASGVEVTGVKIATQSPLSGPQSALGIPIQHGAELAVEQIGEQIGIEGIEVVPFDDQATENIGASNASTIAADPSILCVIGHLNSGVAIASLPTYRDANVVMISPANTNPRITEEFTGTAYRVVGRDDVQGVVAADFARETLGAQNVYVLHDQTAYGEGLATVFRDTLEEAGVTIAGFAGTQEKSAFDAVLTPIQAANPDLVFYGGIYDAAGPLLQQMRERGIEAEFLGGDGLDSSELARLAGEAAVGANYVTVSGPPSAYPAAAQFITDYEAAYDEAAAYPAFQAYDSTRACLTAIANAAIEAGGTPTREQVKAAMAELEPFEGVTGNVEFNDKGDRDPAIYYVLEVTSADPAQWAQNEVADEIESEPPAQ